MSSSMEANGTTSTSNMQPKFKDCLFECDKTPEYFLTWIRLISGIIRNIQGGEPLENFLDNYLQREKNTASTRPEFLNDPLLGFEENPFEDPGSSAPEQGDQESSSITVGQSTSSASNPFRYSDLSPTSVALDKHLFHVLFTIVKGSYLNLITDLTGTYTRYTFAIIAMWKHANLGNCNRRITAMSAMQELIYHGDAGIWKIEFIKRAREVYAAGATIEHFIMQCAFNSFEGKNTQVQAKITEDINDDQLVRPGMNFRGLKLNPGG